MWAKFQRLVEFVVLNMTCFVKKNPFMGQVCHLGKEFMGKNKSLVQFG